MNKKILSAVTTTLLTVTSLIYAGKTPDLVPMPKTYQQTGGTVNVDGMKIFIEKNNRQCEIAADEITLRIKKLNGKSGKTIQGIPSDSEDGIFILTVNDPAAEAFKKQLSLKVSAVYPGPQGYVIRAAGNKIIIIGSDNVGALYGAMTLRQMLDKENDKVQVANANVIDWPDFKFRTGISFQRALMLLGKGGNRMAGIKAGMDWMMRFKMNMIKDYSTLDPRVVPASMKKIWKEANKYAGERGIYPHRNLWSNLYGYTYSRKDLEILPPGIKSKEEWPCVYEARSYREAYYCWSDDEAAKKVINAEADLLKECNFTIFMWHPVDGGGLKNPEQWSKRCPRCRKRWKDDERWKATVHQLGMWNRILKEKNPDLTIYACIYPYHAGYLAMKTKENEKIWQQNVVDYWTNVNKRLDPEIYFATWMASRDVEDQHRSILMGRPMAYDDCHSLQMGVFSTQCRYFITNWYSRNDMMESTGTNIMGNWMYQFNAAEFSWNVASPGCGEYVYPGMLFYDVETDHTGPEVIIKEWLPKANRLFWGDKIASEMAAFYGSGILPKYIVDPGGSISLLNKFRKDPLADTDPHAKGNVTGQKKKETPTLIVDSAARMKVQADAAAKCFKLLKSAYEKSGDLDKFKKVLLVKHYRSSPYWLTIAKARYDMMTGDDLMKAGKNQEALKAYREGLVDYRKNLNNANKILRQVGKIPHPGPRFKLNRIAAKLGPVFTRKIESAETVIKPRQIGEVVKVAVYNGLGGKGTKEFLDQFKNVKATIIKDLSLKTLNKYDCLFMLRDHSVDRFDYFQNLHTYVVKGGGGVVFEHTLCGHKRFQAKTPFPEVCKYSTERRDNFDRKIFTKANPVFRNIKAGTEFKDMYVDFFEPVLGKDGFVLAVDKDKHPMAVAGEVGLGKVIFDGCLSLSSVKNTFASEEKMLYGFNAMLAEKAVEWFTGVKLERK